MMMDEFRLHLCLSCGKRPTVCACATSPSRPPEQKDDFWLSNSHAKETIALHIGHLIVDLLRRDPDILIRIQYDYMVKENLHFRASLGDHHAARDFKPQELELLTHPRAKAQHESDDLFHMLERLRRATR